jgi:hypothetical protein
MWSIAKPFLALSDRLSARAVGLVLAALMVGGCGTVEFESGSRFDPALLEQSLRAGSSTQSDVQAALGEPHGRGRALMPFHEMPHTVWTYYYERGSIDISSSQTKDQRTYLFVLFADDRYDGYMWFVSEMQ